MGANIGREVGSRECFSKGGRATRERKKRIVRILAEFRIRAENRQMPFISKASLRSDQREEREARPGNIKEDTTCHLTSIERSESAVIAIEHVDRSIEVVHFAIFFRVQFAALEKKTANGDTGGPRCTRGL